MKPSTTPRQYRPRRFQPCPGEHAWREVDRRLTPSADLAVLTMRCDRCHLITTELEVQSR